MQSNTTTKRMRFIVNAVYFALILILVYLFFKYLFIWLLPFIIAAIIAAAVEPFIKFCEKYHIKRGFSAAVSTLGLWGIISFAFYKLSSVIFSELVRLSKSLPNFFAQVPDIVNSIIDKYKNIIEAMPIGIKENSDTITQTLKNSLDPISKSVTAFIIDFIQGAAMALPALFILFIVAVVASVFMSADFPKIKKFIIAQFPVSKRPAVRSAKNFLFEAIFNFFKAYATIIFITFIELSIGLTLLKFDYAITLAALIALVDILPIIGTNTILIPWGIILMISGNIPRGIWIIVLSLTISTVRQAIEPKIIGHHLGLYPLITLICIYVGLQLFGILGMFILPLSVMLFKHMQETGYLKIWNDIADDIPLRRKPKPPPDEKEEKTEQPTEEKK